MTFSPKRMGGYGAQIQRLTTPSAFMSSLSHSTPPTDRRVEGPHSPATDPNLQEIPIKDEDGITSDEDSHSGVGDDDGASILPRTVQPLSTEALAEFNAAQERAGVVYISRIPPGMRPTKVRHLMTAYGEVGRVYLQQEDPKRAYLRRKHTSTKKAHYTEGWVEFKDKKVARSVAEMLNAQPIGGKKGTRWRDDVWTMKYLPRFKWNMLTEQVANEAAVHTARLRVELSQSRAEQRDYLRQVELARVLDKRAERKRKAGDDGGVLPPAKFQRTPRSQEGKRNKESEKKGDTPDISSVFKHVF